MKTAQRKVTCSRGHIFYKSSNCPVCPQCWPGYYRKKAESGFPSNLSAPALRALLNAKILNLKDLSKYSEVEILQLHGLGPSSIPNLRQALKEKGLGFSNSLK